MGRRMLCELLNQCRRDTTDFSASYDAMVEYLLSGQADLAKELECRGVKCPDNFYDVALDYLLVDSFEVRVNLPIHSEVLGKSFSIFRIWLRHRPRWWQ